MSAPVGTPDRRMNVAEFFDWYDRQPEGGRYELLDGHVFVKRRPAASRDQGPSLAAERAAHVRAKVRVRNVLQAAIERAGLPCEAFGDGMRVQIDDHTMFEPDAAVDCGAPVDPDVYVLPRPLIVVEVVSPGSRSIDTGLKLERYFENPAVQHYLVMSTERRAVIHCSRTADGISIRLLHGGSLDLVPPGLTLVIEELFG